MYQKQNIKEAEEKDKGMDKGDMKDNNIMQPMSGHLGSQTIVQGLLIYLHFSLPFYRTQILVAHLMKYKEDGDLGLHKNKSLVALVKQQVHTNRLDELGSSVVSLDESSYSDVHNPCLLTCGRAWAISLTFRDAVNEELSRACFPRESTGAFDGLLYRSSLHGKGLNRFWSNVEGYHGPLLLAISADATDTGDGERSHGRWVIGVITAQGFENRDSFYGGPGYLYALSPVFRVYSQSGKGKNFVYSHLHPSVRVYDPHPKPVGLAFGGTIGNERIFIDEDFSRVIVRHHAVDKTYQSGPLLPNQGFLPTEALILDFEVWGFGGKAAKERQEAYKRREELFSEQRRKVDLKTFASWEDSPEKMMMDMMTDPNRVEREDR
ncbi:hypothetical protein Taro_031823 [Colocasia esculenta]|uniref:TLDc domain-containing protein n=1 Tax=Colocasia esculenta TaxID=4460 RepID=A0A843W7J7_COLES|nr:hypothetical protein [Colocasia esculenta]